ncbi:MAG: hypothetical protein A2X86_02660 [Bdellovibrionales bacterium GWA2_49_15]|nr:MAG: hypothetical protein A2X86_02660 [Bdellovibrionales bacterium GWA2_49_15]
MTTRSNDKCWFALPLEHVWELSIKALAKANRDYPAEIYQYVLMANHYHLLIRTPNENLDQFMYIFNKNFSEQLQRASGHINRMFGSRYKWSLIENQRHLLNVYRYVYQNPLRAGVHEKCEEYPYSCLYFRAKKLELAVPTHELFSLRPEMMDFLNQRVGTQQEQQIKKGLHKARFKEPTVRDY